MVLNYKNGRLFHGFYFNFNWIAISIFDCIRKQVFGHLVKRIAKLDLTHWGIEKQILVPLLISLSIFISPPCE